MKRKTCLGLVVGGILMFVGCQFTTGTGSRSDDEDGNGSASGGSAGGGGGGANAGGGSTPGTTVAGGACKDAGGLQPGAPWPMQGACPTRQAQVGFAGPSDPTLAWSVTLDGVILTEPVVAADGTIYVITDTGDLVAVSHDGGVLWTHHFNGGTTTLATPAIGVDGTIYFGFEDEIIAVRPDGTEAWAVAAGGQKSSPVIGPDGSVYVQATTGTFYALTANGDVRWTFETHRWSDVDDHDYPEPSLAHDALHFGDPTEREALAVWTDGSLKWRHQSEADASHMMASLEDHLLTFRVALDWETGERVSAGYAHRLGRVAHALGGGVVMANTNAVQVVEGPSNQLWYHALSGSDGAGSVAVDVTGAIFTALRGGNNVALKLTVHGEEEWTYRGLNGTEVSSNVYLPGVALAPNRLYVPRADVLWAFEGQ